MVVNYNKGIIYKLCCKDPEITDIYIGSTTDFTKRKWKHKSDCKNRNSNVHQFIKNNGNWDNWDMIQVEAYKADNKRDLESRERHWIETLKSTLNKNRPYITDSECREYNCEYYQNNKVQFAEKSAIYRQNNKESLSEKRAVYLQNNKESIAEKGAIYYQKNKKKITEYHIEYRQNNKEQIAEKGSVKVICECGSEVTKNALTRHKKTQKHLKYLETI